MEFNFNYIYLLQEREFIRTKENVYKIGRTTRGMERFSQYPKGSKILLLMNCVNCINIEKQLIDAFKQKYKHCKNYGNEYFEGDQQQMKKDIYDIISNECIRINEIIDNNKLNNFPLNAINERFAFIKKSKPIVIDEKTGVMYDVHNFNIAFQNEYYTTIDNDGNEKKEKIIPVWLAHEKRRTFDKINFMPKINGNTHDTYNLWKGFAILSEKTENYDQDIKKWEYHIKDVWCNGNEIYAKFTMNWFAFVLQKRQKPKSAIVIKSEDEQTGKGICLEILETILGKRHYLTTTNFNRLKNWNGRLENCLLLNLNESYFAGDKSIYIKTLITDKTLDVEKKGIDPYSVDSCFGTIITTNEDWNIPAKEGSARYFCIECSPKHRGDTKYFEEFAKINPQNVLYYLLHLDISNFKPTEFEQTDSLKDQIEMNKTPAETFFSDKILTNDYKIFKTKTSIFDDYCKYTNDKYANSTQFWKRIKNLCNKSNVILNEKRTHDGTRMIQFNVPNNLINNIPLIDEEI